MTGKPEPVKNFPQGLKPRSEVNALAARVGSRPDTKLSAGEVRQSLPRAVSTHSQSRGQKCVSEHARRRSAADSGVMSRWGMPSISNPTMNLRTDAERSNGG